MPMKIRPRTWTEITEKEKVFYFLLDYLSLELLGANKLRNLRNLSRRDPKHGKAELRERERDQVLTTAFELFNPDGPVP